MADAAIFVWMVKKERKGKERNFISVSSHSIAQAL